MNELVIVRHGDAGPYTQPDAARELSEAGREEARKTARQLLALQWQDVVIWHSPYVRARQTADILSQVLAGRSLEVAGITPDDHPDTFIRRMDRDDVPERLILVSHMPFVATLEARLTGNQGEPFMTGEARLLRTETIWYPGQAIRVKVMRPL
ncbi:MAG: histidine phosphatase [Gammaproteobacteria bacterium]|nr:MAG: histidine phosphatase [Gammaproteobacteria bacterium]